MTHRRRSAYSISLAVSAALLASACECDDCNRLGPTVGYLRASAADDLGNPMPGVSVHLDNRGYITEPQVTGSNGATVLLVYMDPVPSDTGTVTALPPDGYQNPPPQPVTIVANDTVDVNFILQRE